MEVVTDPDPDAARSAWRTYRHALQTTPDWATHRLVIQDDGLPCRHFAEVVDAAVAARPDRMLCLCVCGNAIATTRNLYAASHAGHAWALLNSAQWVPAIAVVWPVGLIEPGLAYVDSQHWPTSFNADDEIIGRIVRHLKEYVLCTVPSLVEHDDMQPSAAGRHTRYGADLGRVTACPPPPDCDLRMQDWTGGPS